LKGFLWAAYVCSWLIGWLAGWLEEDMAEIKQSSWHEGE
jgi:hypothetical protein